MGKSFSKTFVVCGIALATAWRIAGPCGVDGEGYLSKVGPVPLRYQTVRASEPLNLPPLPSEPRSTAEVVTLPAQTDAFSLLRKSASTEIPAQFFLPAALWLNRFSGQNSLDSLLPASTSSVTNSTAAASSPASDLLTVTPEMLVDYFKPVQPPTNAANATVPGLLEFLPASPAVWGSTATYKTP